jgi:hypothetical protein
MRWRDFHGAGRHARRGGVIEDDSYLPAMNYVFRCWNPSSILSRNRFERPASR